MRKKKLMLKKIDIGKEKKKLLQREERDVLVNFHMK